MKLFETDKFVPTKWDTEEDKRKFAQHFLRFVESGFSETLFFGWFYKRLSNTFGHIAHYDRGGFWDEFFTCSRDKANFLKLTLEYPCWGDPTCTYSDVERAIQKEVLKRDYLKKYERAMAVEAESRDRSELARLKEKYEKGAVTK